MRLEKIKYVTAVGIMAILILTTAAPAVGAAENSRRVDSAQQKVSFGNMGADVWQLQLNLNEIGYKLKPFDGVYGFRTRAAVREFQQKHGFKVNGVADRQTNEEIKRVLVERNKSKKLKKRGYSPKDVELLARAVNGEARGESLEGQVAVAAVIVNRTKSPEFPKSVGGVIFQSGAFDAVDDGQIWLDPDNNAYKAAELALQGHDPTGKALYYYNPAKTTNRWIWSRPVVKKIGRHVFAR